ncbi:MAG TPA: hypothetical protein VE010_08460, partial [Thermoanaerobaculia bacterium]|nr:hypothetical protein [Thermoanaerobaculia bacterium]
MSRRPQIVLAVCVIALAALAFLQQRPLDVFWGPDSANRFIQVQQLLRSGSIRVEYLARDLDPEMAIAPTGGHHFIPRDGELVSFYGPAFPLLTAPLYAAFGAPGLFVIPIAATLLLVPLFALLLPERRAMFGAALLLVFATPLFFYTVVYWEHTLAVALTIAAFVLATRDRPLLAGLAGAAGAVFREEGYIALACLGMAMLATRANRRAIALLVAGAAAILTPLWIANYLVFQHPLGLHAAVYGGFRSGLAEKATNFLVYLFNFT